MSRLSATTAFAPPGPRSLAIVTSRRSKSTGRSFMAVQGRGRCCQGQDYPNRCCGRQNYEFARDSSDPVTDKRQRRSAGVDGDQLKAPLPALTIFVAAWLPLDGRKTFSHGLGRLPSHDVKAAEMDIFCLYQIDRWGSFSTAGLNSDHAKS